MKQFLKLLVAGAVCGMGFIGCGLVSPTDDDTISIDIKAIGDVRAGDDKPIGGTIEGKPDPDATGISAKILDSDGATVAAEKIKVTKNTPSAKSKFDLTTDLSMKIVSTAEACNGTYTLEISAAAGSATTTKTATFTIVNGKDCNAIIPTGTPITEVTLEAGANGNSTLGSSIDLDGGTVWKMTEAANNVSKIDICYAHTASGDDKVGSANWAKLSDYTFAKNWATPPDCKMHAVTMTADAYTAVDTKEEITALWSESTAVTSLKVVDGDIFIVKTTENVLALVKITSQTAGETGKITIKVGK